MIKRLRDLNRKTLSNEERIKALEDKIWLLENPPQFDAGDEVEIERPLNTPDDTGIVVSREVTKEVWGLREKYWEYCVLIPKNKASYPFHGSSLQKR